MYYSGGYITQHHGNSDILDAIQLETPSDLRKKDTVRFGFILGRIISSFYQIHYVTFRESVDSWDLLSY